MEIKTSITHPNTNPNAVTCIACPKVFHCTVSDAETDKQKSHNDMHDRKNPRHVGDLA